MNRIIRILTFISVVIMTLSCVALLACIVLQESLVQVFVGISGEIVRESPSIPIGPIVYALGNLAIAIFLLLSAGKQKNSLWAEVICAVATGAGLPILRDALTDLQAKLTGSLHLNAVLSLSSVTNLCDHSLLFVDVAVTLMLVVCGMGIAIKYTQSNSQGALH